MHRRKSDPPTLYGASCNPIMTLFTVISGVLRRKTLIIEVPCVGKNTSRGPHFQPAQTWSMVRARANPGTSGSKACAHLAKHRTIGDPSLRSLTEARRL